MNLSDVGTGERVDEVLGPYPGLRTGVFHNETDALLAALLLEQRADRTGTNPTVAQDERQPDDVGGTYTSILEGLSPGEDWTQLQPGFVSSEIDLRSPDVDNIGTDGEVLIGFTEEQPDVNTSGDGFDFIRYSAGDFPVTGIPIETGNIWVQLSDDAAGIMNLYMEVWG